MNISYEEDRDTFCKSDKLLNVECVEFDTKINARKAVEFNDYEKEIERYAGEIENNIGYERYSDILVLGTEECMYPALRLGEILNRDGAAEVVRVHATTRSPIIASGAEDYPLSHRYQIRSV